MGGGGDKELLFNGHKASVWEDEKVLEIDGGDSYITMQMYSMPLNHTFEMVKILNFMLCISSRNF